MQKADYCRFAMIIQELDKMEIAWWIDHGTLLGIIRDKAIIPWDNDIDLSIFGTDINRTYKTLIKNLRTKLDAHIVKTQRNIKIIPYSLEDKQFDISAYLENGNDSFVKKLIEFPRSNRLRVRKLRKTIWYGCRAFEHFILLLMQKMTKSYVPYVLINSLLNMVVRIRESVGRIHYSSVPSKYFSKQHTIIWEHLELKIPNNTKEYLEYRYGKTWETPEKNWTWWKHDYTVSLN